MDYFIGIVSIVISGILTNNIVLNQSIGICPFLGVSKKTQSAVGMGLAVTFVITVSTSVCWLLYSLVLEPLDIGYLSTIAFILVIASLVQLLDIVLKKTSPTLYNSLGVYLALITTNCAVLGTANSAVILDSLDFFQSLMTGLSIGLGFTVALILMAGIREKQALYDVPRPFAGFPIALVTAGIMAMAFYGFSGLSFV
ncbi:MAG: RnfABCDGE type electron transport complex subunit A [Clostridiales bacterium]|nr:RnfABCDGE type electron transport complex subunit A [Clostridiales bacterium]